MICWYTTLLLEKCMNKYPQIKSYADIGEVVFRHRGKAVIVTFLYVNLFLVIIELLILKGDNRKKLFPNMNFRFDGLRIDGKKCFILLITLVILPTTWLRSSRVLAYISGFTVFLIHKNSLLNLSVLITSLKELVLGMPLILSNLHNVLHYIYNLSHIIELHLIQLRGNLIYNTILVIWSKIDDDMTCELESRMREFYPQPFFFFTVRKFLG
ncbi:Amino acid transporter AVT1B, partial [Mucuna pruriens]